MSPFDLPGPSFLLFYLITCIFFIIISQRWVWWREIGKHPLPLPLAQDPYLIACLQGGPNAALRLATIALLERACLSEINGKVVTTPPLANLTALEHEVLSFFRTAHPANEIFGVNKTITTLSRYKQTLVQHGLWHNARSRWRRLLVTWLTGGLLIAMGIVKFQLAVAHDHHNVGILFVLLLILGMYVVVVSIHSLTANRTRRGHAMLKQLKALHLPQRHRLQMASSPTFSPEVLMIAAVFGTAVLPATAFPYLTRIYPAGLDASVPGGCGSSSGDSGSGGDGGGGCGGCGGGGD